MNDGGMTVVFSPQGARACDETPLKPVGSIDLKRENRTFWMHLPKAYTGGVQRIVEQIPGNPLIEEKRQDAPSSDPVTQDNEEAPVPRARKPPPRPTVEELDKHELTHVVFRSWCRRCVSGRAREDPHRRIATHEGRTPKVMLPASKSLVRAMANARVHRTLPRHGPPYSHQIQGPVEACIQVYRGIFVANKLALEAGIGSRLLMKHPVIVWLIRHVAWVMTRYNTGRERIFGKPHDGSTS